MWKKTFKAIHELLCFVGHLVCTLKSVFMYKVTHKGGDCKNDIKL